MSGIINTGDMGDVAVEQNSENSFLVRIQYRQNASWQGTVQWVESGKTQHFRSCLELIRLIDMAVSSGEETQL